MNKCLSLVHVIASFFMISHPVSAQDELRQARTLNLRAEPEQVLDLHLRPERPGNLAQPDESRKSDRGEVVDYVLTCERPHSFLVASEHSAFVFGEAKNVAQEDPPASSSYAPRSLVQELQRMNPRQLENPHWQGKLLRVAVGQTMENKQQMLVAFAVLNASARTIELLPPRIQLAGGKLREFLQ